MPPWRRRRWRGSTRRGWRPRWCAACRWVVVGEEDEITPPAESVILRDRIPGVRLVTVAGAGHLSSLEQPEAWNAALREFLRGFAPNGAGASG
jgi:pimeloyl-ACP methyl ester carboxylesterase